ncbi:gliding motility-associated C-terminal domain-containing protein [Mucilaginibacter sp. OK098]|uniref:gliding motility-associated C-terminal domain-containing protein n=1 Tax=Mucilaginibacter sp. OK098 TaxID=1855297 RepID=UPI0009213B1C|nr:gliding motility-associated C-terminal domain-containing protein [Mucilaginibacter sp. OK098]SHN25270.1 gliding motility-associated C-terminal domain-containing protein [Mucilaginibacter sp. OK098]
MKPIWLKLFLLVVCITLAIKSQAQVCTGSLGDPVINQDFGSGTNQGAPLGSNVTNYNYFGSDCPNDGSYTIASSTNGCFGQTWHTLSHDHTGNPNGYMMIVNASNNPGLFYTQSADAGQLCPNTTYEFAAYITNLIIPSACGGASSQPNITFSIETTTGQVLKTYNTGNIPPTDETVWAQYGTFFTTPANVTNVIVKMINNAPGGCGNDLALDDITFRACGQVVQAGFGSFSGSAAQDVCIGSNTMVTLQAKVNGNPVYQWQYNTGGNNWADIPGANSDTYIRPADNTVLGTYLYRVGVVANGGDISSLNCRVYSLPLTATVIPLPVAAAIAPQTFCEGTTLTLTASGGATYIWSGPDLAPTLQNPLVINNIALADAGTYTVVPISAQNCTGAPANVQVSIIPKPVANVIAVAPICAGEHTQLGASGGLYYKWTPSTGLNHDDVPNPIATPLVTTTYNVNVSNDYCTDTKSIIVTVNQNPVANGGGNKNIFEGQSVKLSGTVKGDKISSILWSPATALDDPTSATPIANPTDDITYTMTVTSQSCGISVSAPVFVKVYKKIIIPNTFSPNNDGINDQWNIEALFTYPESSTLVFDRYGKKVYQSIGYSKAWDGTYNGSALPEGTYYYVIDLKNNTPKLSGWVFIVR